MVDAQPVDLAAAHQLKRQRVDGIEDDRLLDPDPDETGDLEEAAIAQPPAGLLPEGQLPGLQFMDGLQIGAVARCRGKRIGKSRRGIGDFAHAVMQVLRSHRIGRTRDRGQPLRCRSRRRGQRLLPARRMEREAIVEMGERQRAGIGIEDNGEIAACGNFLEGRVQHRQRQPLRPVDVEEAGTAAVAAPLDDVPPPWVLQRRRHVVGHDVEDEPEPGAAKCGRKPVEALAPAKRRIDLIVVDDVIAMSGAGRGGEDRRCVEMADAEIAQMRHDRDRRVEIRPVTELQAIGRRGQFPHLGRSSRIAAATARTSSEFSSPSRSMRDRRRQFG